jgi:hypothetical protein
MSIDRAYAPGWSLGEIVTSAQLNALDQNTARGIDKRVGQSDVFGSVIQATGGGRFISTVQTGPDANLTFQVNQHNAIVRIPTLTDARKYMLGHSGATGGDRMYFYVEGTGCSPSGYVDIANNVGTGLFRLGMSRGFYATGIAGWNDSAQGDACEVIYNGAGWVLKQGGGPGVRSIDFTAVTATEWTCPPGVFSVFLFGYGGGGGGGAGSAGGTAVTDDDGDGNLDAPRAGSGSGGGGAWPRWFRIAVTPGTVYEALAGDGGAGGSTAGESGSAGGDSVFREKASGNVLATFRGADYGATAGSVTTSFSEPFAFGGSPVRNAGSITRTVVATGVVKSTIARLFPGLLQPSSGGLGTTVNSSTSMGQDGMASAEGYSGGTQGAQGAAASSSYYGGGGGGGGGAGPGGNGGAGGAGGNGSADSTTTAGAGTSGTAAASNTGAGGGGGGGGGSGAGGGGTAGLGGRGGTGKISLVFFK